MADSARPNSERNSFSQPQGSALSSEHQQQNEPQQLQQPATTLVRTAHALKRPRARDVLQDGASDIPAEKKAVLAEHGLFELNHELHRLRAQSQTPRRSSQGSSQQSIQPQQGRASNTIAATTTPAPVNSNILYSKTWKLYRTTPFYRYDPMQAARDGSELLSYMTANAPKLTMADSAVAQAATSVTAPGGSGGESGGSSYPSSVVTAAGRALSALTITERASRPFPPQINQDGENIVERIDVVNEVKSVVFQQLDLLLDTEEEPSQENEDNSKKMTDNSFIISIVISYRGKAADQTSYIALIDDPSKRTSNSLNGTVAANGNTGPFTHFSLVMAKAPAALSALVMEWIERRYDCRICPLMFPTYELRAFVNHWLEYLYGSDDSSERENGQHIFRSLQNAKVKQVDFHYGFPNGVQGLKTMAVSLSSEDVRELSNSREADSETGLLEGIEDHCSDCMGIDFGRLILTRVGCPSWYIAGEGKLKIHPVSPGKQSLLLLLQSLIKHGT
ncbi:hypothetical protein BGW41_002283 [Actinomortierella wolfii]|nr:hypothetical protein BGW41_002283 [Actinomortierella wolfii]